MPDTYYSVGQIAEMLNLHPKTILRYIRKGSLRAGKIGKSWHVSGHDLSVFLEKDLPPRNEAEGVQAVSQRVEGSLVVDIPVYGAEQASRISRALTAAMNGKPPEYGRANLYVQHVPEEGKVRVSLWGGAGVLAFVAESIASLTDEPEGELE